MSLTIPDFPIRVERPDDNVSEYEKFLNNGEWFLKQARWRILQYYNTYFIPNNYQNAAPVTGIVSSSGNNVSFVGSRSIVDEMLENYSYFFGNQDNRIFNFLTTGARGNALPNVWIKGQEVFQLGQHLVGKGLELILPIEDNISCESISENALLKKKEVFDSIDAAAAIAQSLNEVSGGTVKYTPAGDINYTDPSQVKKAKDKVRQNYENTATVIGRNVYYENELKEKFLNNVQDTVICNLTGIEFTERKGKCTSTYIPGYQAIYDYSTWGEYGDTATTAGYIVPSTLEEIITDYPNLSPRDRQEIEDVLHRNIDGYQAFMDYWQQPFQNVRWYYNQQKWISKATLYWISECNLPYVKKENYGVKKTQRIDPYKTYQLPTDKKNELGNQIFDVKKGHEIKGATRVYKVHKAVIAGNKYLLEYGYDTYQVRPFGDKEKPELPIKFFCQGKLAGYVKPIVSRLKPKQDELDAVRYRIREYTANDLGVNIFINGAKLTEGLSALNIVNDLRTAHVTVLTPTGDEVNDAQGIDDIVKVFANNAVAAIKDYLVLKADILKEMKDALNISDISLGDQTSTVGKGVQQQTIARAEISSLPFFSSLQEYWRRCLQYAANKSKMILLDSQNKNVILPVSEKEVEMLEITKEMRTQDLFVYLNPDDRMEVEELSLFKQMLQAYAQNPSVEHAHAIVNALKMMKTKSFGEAIAIFENFIQDEEQRTERDQLRQVQMEQQAAGNEALSKQIADSQAQMATLMTELAKIQAKGAWDVKNTEVKSGLDSAFKMDDDIINKIAGLVTQQLQQTAAPQQQAEMVQ